MKASIESIKALKVTWKTLLKEYSLNKIYKREKKKT